jgi:hypothetical protein
MRPVHYSWLWQSCRTLAGKSSTSCNGRADDVELLVGGGSPGHERGKCVGGVAVKGMPRPVVAAGGARVGVAGGVLHIAQRDPSVPTPRSPSCAAGCAG